jgi:L-serine dehydratase
LEYHERSDPPGTGGRRGVARSFEFAQKASTYYIKATGYKDSLKTRGLVFAYALAVSEENASGGKIVNCPYLWLVWCGTGGTLSPAQKSRLHDIRIIRALATAGLFGNIVKHNASISGAEVGCQGEVGVACAMASAAANQLFGGSPHKRNMLLKWDWNIIWE